MIAESVATHRKCEPEGNAVSRWTKSDEVIVYSNCEEQAAATSGL